MISLSGAAGGWHRRVAGRDQLTDSLRIRSHEGCKGQRYQADPTRHEPRDRQDARVDLFAGEERAEDCGAEDRTEHGAGKDVRDSARAPLRRIHVPRGRANQERNPTGGADEREAGDHGDGLLRRRPERGQAAADRAERKADEDDRDAAETVHRPSGRKR